MSLTRVLDALSALDSELRQVRCGVCGRPLGGIVPPGQTAWEAGLCTGEHTCWDGATSKRFEDRLAVLRRKLGGLRAAADRLVDPKARAMVDRHARQIGRLAWRAERAWARARLSGPVVSERESRTGLLLLGTAEDELRRELAVVAVITERGA